MFCNKCDYNNLPENTYCANCGEQLINNMSENNSNNNRININKSSIRMALKKEAKACKKGKLIAFMIIGALIMLGMSQLLDFILLDSMFSSDAASTASVFFQITSLIVNSLLGSFVGLGLNFASLKVIRNQEFTIGSIFKDVFSKMKYVLTIGLAYALGISFQLKIVTDNVLLL